VDKIDVEKYSSLSEIFLLLARHLSMAVGVYKKSKAKVLPRE